MLEGPYSDAEIEAAVHALTTRDRLAGAQDTVSRFAPQLQRVLNQALLDGGWFGPAHDAEVAKAAALADADERTRAVGTLVAEETRLGLMVGVAVGIELARELAKHPESKEN